MGRTNIAPDVDSALERWAAPGSVVHAQWRAVKAVVKAAQRYRIDYERCTRWVPRPDTYGVGRALARLERVSRGGRS